MLISEVKPIGKFGKNLLENADANEIIKKIIEKPLQKACIEFKNKNIETVMSSCNKNNLVKKNNSRVTKFDIREKMNQNKTQTFLRVGKGYAWIMINYSTLSDENTKILFDLENELGEDNVLFVKSNYVDVLNAMRKPFRLKPIVEKFDDTYNEQFLDKQLVLMYNNKYPRRSVFIRMPVDENTKDIAVEKYFLEVADRFVQQQCFL